MNVMSKTIADWWILRLKAKRINMFCTAPEDMMTRQVH
jgi:hypothetical protein